MPLAYGRAGKAPLLNREGFRAAGAANPPPKHCTQASAAHNRGTVNSEAAQPSSALIL